MFYFLISKEKKKEYENLMSETDKLMEYLLSVRPNKTLSKKYYRYYKKFKKQNITENFEAKFTNLYLNWENFLLRTLSLEGVQEWDQQKFRDRLVKKEGKIDTNKLYGELKILFDSERRQKVHFYELYLQSIAYYLIKNHGYTSFTKVTKESIKNTIFKNVVYTKEGFDFGLFNEEVVSEKHIYPDKRIDEFFKNFVEIFYAKIEEFFGEKISKEVFDNSFTEFQKRYDTKTTSTVVKIIPDSILTNDEWLSVLSKQELEREVREKTSELNDLNASLDKKVKERTQELQKAYEELKVLDKKKSDFISVVGHQMRTPLSGLKWTFDLLKKEDVGSLNEQQKDLITKSASVNDEMIDIVNQILEAENILHQKESQSVVELDLVSMFTKAIERSKLLAEEKSIKISLKSEGQPLMVKAERAKLENVLQILIENSIIYNKPEGVVEVSCYKKENMAICSVKDTGIGIPKDIQDDIFKKFLRAENAKHQKPNGMGLGLFIAKETVNQYKGKLWFESKENKGTTFYLELPIVV